MSDHVVQQMQSFLVRMMEEFGNIWKQKACLLVIPLREVTMETKVLNFCSLTVNQHKVDLSVKVASIIQGFTK